MMPFTSGVSLAAICRASSRARWRGEPRGVCSSPPGGFEASSGRAPRTSSAVAGIPSSVSQEASRRPLLRAWSMEEEWPFIAQHFVVFAGPGNSNPARNGQIEGFFASHAPKGAP